MELFYYVQSQGHIFHEEENMSPSAVAWLTDLKTFEKQ